MFQVKARHCFPVIALTAALCLSPLASASAATADTSEGGLGLLAQVETQIVLIWDALQGAWTNAGLRLDPNG